MYTVCIQLRGLNYPQSQHLGNTFYVFLWQLLSLYQYYCMMKTFFENVFPILYSRKFCPEMFSFPANYCNNVVLCFCYGLITALCFAFPLPIKEWNGISMPVMGTLVSRVLICHHLVLQMYSVWQQKDS